MQDLKNCPFCGHVATVVEHNLKRGLNCPYAIVTCDECVASVMEEGARETPMEQITAAAVLKWNRRFGEPIHFSDTQKPKMQPLAIAGPTTPAGYTGTAFKRPQLATLNGERI